MVEKKLNFNQPILSVRRCSLKTDETKTKNVVPHLQPPTPGPVRNPGAVPFQWEQIPGKPKVAEVSPPSRCPNISDNEMKDEVCDESLVDEIDALSRTESFVSSCSASSLNGADDRDDDSSATFSTVKQEKTGFWYRPTFAKSCAYYNDKDEKQVCDEHENLLTICCLFPRSCLKSSVCFVNPVPATSVMARFAVYPSTGTLSGCSSADSSSETENEDTVKSVVETTDDELGENKNKANVAKDIAQLESYDEALSFGFKTLQELLADEDNRKEMESISSTIHTFGDHLNIMSLADEKPKAFGRDEDLYVDSRKKRMGKNEEKQQLSRATTLGNSIPQFPIPPPLPRSPSDSWLFRTMATKKASSPSFMSRCTNK